MKTFKPKKKHDKDTKRYDLHKQAKATLGVKGLREAVKLPPREDLNEWIAVHTVDFFNAASLIYGSVREFCTDQSCPNMSAGPKVEYLSTFQTETAVSMPANRYIAHLLTWIAQQLDNPSVFPPGPGLPFPKSFMSNAKNILKRLFRVYAHIYYSHFDAIRSFGEEAHLNTSFKHFIYFVQEFKLVDKADLEPMAPLIARLCT